MPIDAYQPCPCGSGKKLKFCCSNLVTEMSKVHRLQENDQYRLALQTLEQLDQAHPNNPWVATTRASVLLQDDNPVGAVNILDRMLEVHPDHVFGIALYGFVRFLSTGFNEARPAIFRAFQKAAHAYPDVVGGLATAIANTMLEEGKYLSARAHLVFSMRLVVEGERENAFRRLLDFEGSREIPYPMRSVHALVPYAGDDATKKDAERARRLAEIGCWGASAQLYGQLAEIDPESCAVWQNLGLCRAWNGDEARAAEALHRAARLASDSALAVELETIAQILDGTTTKDLAAIELIEYPIIGSVAKVLTLLDSAKRLARVSISQNPEVAETDIVASYRILDRECDEDNDLKSAGTRDVPVIIGQVGIFDAVSEGDDELPAHVILSAQEGEPLAAARELLEQAAAGEIGPGAPPENEAMRRIETYPREQAVILSHFHFPAASSIGTRDRLKQEHWQCVTKEIWPTAPLHALAGKSPEQAAGDPDLKLPLTAALYAFDALCEANQYSLDIESLAQSLQVELPPAIGPDDAGALNNISSMQLNRLPVEQLTDERLIYTYNRALLIRHSRFLRRVLQEVLRRPSCVEKVDLDRVYSAMAELALERNQPDESMAWIRQGLEQARARKDSFDAIFRWELRELMTRLRNPADPQLERQIAHMRDYYGPKLPNFEPYLGAIVSAHGVPMPAASHEGVLAAAGASTQIGSGGLWTPDAAADSAEGEKKLWLPGQQ